MSTIAFPDPTHCHSIKIAYIGGGSRGWARNLMQDLAMAGTFTGEIALYDLDFETAKINEQVAANIFKRPESKTTFKVKAVKRLADCLRNADFVVLSIEPGPTEARFADLEIPREYGIVQPVGDTVGPGGLLRALRAVPVYAEYAARIMEICPKAWVINYTNPMTLCTRALYAVAPEIRAFGCCHEVFGTQKKLATLAEQWFDVETIPRDEIKVDVNGINHFTWVTAASWREHDLMPRLREYVADPTRFADQTKAARQRVRQKKYFGSENLVSLDLMRRLGALGAAGDRHLVEFVPWYARDEKSLHRWGVVITPYSYRLERAQSKALPPEYYAENPIKQSGEEGVKQMAALCGLGDLDTNVNLPNRGQSAQLTPEAVVETNAAFRRGALTPLTARPLPEGARALVQRVIDQQELTLRAAMERDHELAFEALLLDPLVTIGTDTAREMFERMLDHVRPQLAAA